ncbi:MAG: gliding motility protein GldM [Bacteroidota bacterium]
MSIPKEPRQLMINLMYIVLTAILALNVSAEILNAFLTMDKSISESSNIINKSNDKLMKSISDQAEAYSQYEQWREKGNTVRQISKTFADYVAGLKQELIEVSGGYNEKGVLKGLKDKDVTTRFLVIEGRGETLEQKIRSTRDELLAMVEEDAFREQLGESMPLKVDALPEMAKQENWSQFTFQQMPVAAVLPILAKLENDVKVSETSILNYFANKTNVDSYKVDAFAPVISADKGYVIVGEAFNAELFLSGYSSTTDNVKISVDGRSLRVRNGKALFTHQANRIGAQTHSMVISFTDPLTGKVDRFTKAFSYEVGERSVTVAADKMNVFYVGVDNPISVSAAGIPSGQVQVTAEGAQITKTSNGHYVVKPSRPGNATIRISGGGLEPVIKEYRVKRIPDPVVLLGNKRSGTMKSAEFRVHPGIRPNLEGFDFDARCRVMGFEMARVRRGEDVQVEVNAGGTYQGKVKRMVEQARAGDTYYFEKIKVKCPGDATGRTLGGMIFNIR